MSQDAGSCKDKCAPTASGAAKAVSYMDLYNNLSFVKSCTCTGKEGLMSWCPKVHPECPGAGANDANCLKKKCEDPGQMVSNNLRKNFRI
jgi:hypothetical protein